MKPIHLIPCGIAAALLLTLPAAWSQEMNYQGRLTDSSGNPLAEGTQRITFSLWDAASGGTQVWGPYVAGGGSGNGLGPLAVIVNGRFNTVLGPLDTAGRPLNAAFSGDRYLEIKVADNAPIQPRQKLLAAPLAMKADIATLGLTVPDASITSAKIADGAIATAKIANGSITAAKLSGDSGAWAGSGGNTYVVNGNIGIGTTAPTGAKLDVEGDIRLNDFKLLLRGGTDNNHALTFGPLATVDGPNLYGFTGGRLGTSTDAQAALFWGTGSHVAIGGSNVSSDTLLVSAFGGASGSIRIGSTSALGEKMLRFGDSNYCSIGESTTDDDTMIVTAEKIFIGAGGSSNIVTRGFLEVNGSFSTSTEFTNRFMDLGGVGSVAPPQTRSVTIFANGDITGNTIRAFSDQRIKKNIAKSDSGHDLQTLLKVEVSDYHYIDTVTKGNRPQKKLIAQQLEKVYPMAVVQSTDVVPDIFRPADVRDGWVLMSSDLKAGERVRLVGDQKAIVTVVAEVRDGGFRPSELPEGSLFVYGREVNDFRTVDYEAVAMLNVSATQELARQVREKDEKIAALEKRLEGMSAMETRLAAMEKSLANIAAAGRPAEAVRKETARR